MEGYELFKAYGFSFGHDHIVHGINFARIGYTKSDMLNRYNENIGEDHFNDLILGYDNAFNEEFVKDLHPVFVSKIDTEFIFNSIINNRLMNNFEFSDIEYRDAQGNSKAIISIKHKVFFIKFNIEFVRDVSADSSFTYYWNIKSEVEHQSYQRFDHMVDIVYNIGLFKCLERQYYRGRNGYKERCGYDHHIRDPRNRSFSLVPHSSDIVKLITTITNNFIKRYDLSNKEEPQSMTFGDLIKKNLENTNNYVIFWLDGSKTDIEGLDEKDAFVKAGYGNGAIRAIDFIGHKEDECNYSWDDEKHTWYNNTLNKLK